MQAQPHHASGGDGTEPRDDLDVAFSIIRSSEYSDLLEQVNLGTGVYADEDLAMQLRNIRSGLVMELSFSESLRKRAIQETKIKLADRGFAYYDEHADEVKQWPAVTEEGTDEHGRTARLRERGDEIWEDLANPRYALSVEQVAAIDQMTGIDPFKPLPHHIAAAFHEATKSKGGRTQDNYFGRVRRNIVEGDAEDVDTGGFLGHNGGT